jgi:hypothetical protein
MTTMDMARRERSIRFSTQRGRMLAHGEPCLATEAYTPGELARAIARVRAVIRANRA